MNCKNYIYSIFNSIAILLGIVGCASVETRQPNVANQLSSWPNPDALGRRETFVKGLPYHLPTTQLGITLRTTASGTEQQKVTKIDVDSELIPDPDKRFVLRSSNNLIFSRTHNLIVNNGLLTKVHTNDVSKLGDAIGKAAETALTLATGKPATVDISSSTKDFDGNNNSPINLPSASTYPTEAEIEKILQMIPLGEQKYSMPLHGQLNESVPGTRDILKLSARVEGARSGDHQPSWRRPDDGLAKAILVRTLISRNVVLELRVSMVALNALRREEADAEINKRRAQLPGFNILKNQQTEARNYHAEQIAKWRVELQPANKPSSERTKWLNARIQEREKSQIDLRASIRTNAEKLALLENTIDQAERYKRKLYGKGYKTIRTTKLPVFVTDDTHTYAIPVESAFLGQTNNDLTLANGVVTNISRTEPALLYEIVKVPADIVRSAIGVSTTRAAAQEKAIKQEIDLLKAKADLERAKAGDLPGSELIEDE